MPKEWSELNESHLMINKWIKKVIEGKPEDHELHGLHCWKGVESCLDEVTLLEEEVERMVAFLTYGPNATIYNYKHYGRADLKNWALDTKQVKTRSGRVVKESLDKYTKWDGISSRSGTVSMLWDTEGGNPYITELMSKAVKGMGRGKSRKERAQYTPEIKVDVGRIRVSMATMGKMHRIN